MSSLPRRIAMNPRLEELQAAFDRSSDSRKAVVGGLAGGVGGAVGALADTGGDVYAQLAVTVLVTVVAVVCLLAAVAHLDRRTGASA